MAYAAFDMTTGMPVAMGVLLSESGTGSLSTRFSRCADKYANIGSVFARHGDDGTVDMLAAKALFKRAGVYSVASKSMLGVGAILSGASYVHNMTNGNYRKAAWNSADFGMGTTFAMGPVGIGVGILYIGNRLAHEFLSSSVEISPEV